MSDKTATQISAEEWDAVRKLRERDQRAHMLADGTVAAIMQKYGRIDPRQAEKAAAEIAKSAVALLIKRIYEDDAELKALTMERDHYRDRLIGVVEMTPPGPWVIAKPPEPNHE